ncbi:MAG: FAD binding domain-containing protein [Burkholderiales bacterium]|nr:FAD binding domain-containing protein [Burkholderiales bacterium]
MKPVAFDYARPATVAAAVELLASANGSAKVIAGGQSLGPMLNLRLAQPGLLVDIRRIPGLNEVKSAPGGYLVGSCVTHAAIEDGEIPDFTRGFMRKVAAGIAYRAVRNRGTIGGSVCHADPAADWLTALTLLSAVAVIEGPGGRREMLMTEFVTGPFETRLEPGELLLGMRVPALSARSRWSYRKIQRKPGEFGEAIGAMLRDDDSGICRAVIGAASGPPRVIEDAGFLAGEWDRRRVHAALEEAGVADDAYRARLHGAALRRAAAELAA